MTERIQIGWRKLSNILNDVIIKNLNLQKPIQGAGISLSETASGTIISAIKPGDDTSGTDTGSSGGGTGPTSGGWKQIDIMDSSCNRSTIWVWASATDPNVPS